VLPDDVTAQLLKDHGSDLQATADRLVAQVNARGGPDNVSIVLVRTGDQFLRDKKEIAKLSKESNG
jgi:serine/threonine protein phosphatase PrpC